MGASRRGANAIRYDLRRSFGIEEMFDLTKIVRWFLAQIKDRGF